MSRLGQTKEKLEAFADSKGIIVFYFFILLKRCKKQNFLIAPLLGISDSHMHREVWECQSAHKASLQPRPYGQCEPNLGSTCPLTVLSTLDIATLKISDVPGTCKGCTNLMRGAVSKLDLDRRVLLHPLRPSPAPTITQTFFRAAA